MRAYILAAALLTPFSLTSSIVHGDSSPSQATAQGKYSTSDTEIGTLLDDPAARAIVDKHIPGFSSGDQIEMARAMTLKSIQQFAPDMISDQALAAIDSDLAALASEK